MKLWIDKVLFILSKLVFQTDKPIYVLWQILQILYESKYTEANWKPRVMYFAVV